MTSIWVRNCPILSLYSLSSVLFLRTVRLSSILRRSSGTSCWDASLRAQEGSQCASTINPSKPRSIALWERGCKYFLAPPMWLGSAKTGNWG